MEGTIKLEKQYFTEKEKALVDYGVLKVSNFKCKSGIRAVRIENDRGHIIVLP